MMDPIQDEIESNDHMKFRSNYYEYNRSTPFPEKYFRIITDEEGNGSPTKINNSTNPAPKRSEMESAVRSFRTKVKKIHMQQEQIVNIVTYESTGNISSKE